MTSLTQRSSGLVQRRTEASRNAADKERAAGGGGGNDEDDAQSRRDEQDDDDKGDSKETRLTLMEEVLLLGLKDREVRARRAGRGRPVQGPGATREPGYWLRASALRAPELRARERLAHPLALIVWISLSGFSITPFILTPRRVCCVLALPPACLTRVNLRVQFPRSAR